MFCVPALIDVWFRNDFRGFLNILFIVRMASDHIHIEKNFFFRQRFTKICRKVGSASNTSFNIDIGPLEPRVGSALNGVLSSLQIKQIVAQMKISNGGLN